MIDIQENTLTISGKSDGKTFETSVNLFAEVIPSESKTNILGFQVQILLAKKDEGSEYWPRLTKENAKFNNITVDWNKYIDEDDEKEEASKGLADWD